MKTKYSMLSRAAITAVAVICICHSVLAGPGTTPKFIMINGQMMELVPMTKDMTLKNGCKVCTKGTVTTSGGKTVAVKDGDVISSEGKIMSPAAVHLHGG